MTHRPTATAANFILHRRPSRSRCPYLLIRATAVQWGVGTEPCLAQRRSLYALEFRRMPNLRRHANRETSVIRRNANGIERAVTG
jgi:hypothetical protein